MSDFNSLIAEVKANSDIVEVCERNGVQVTQTGYRHKALCPFHQESTPSFIIDDRSQTFHCFGCGERGDVLEFVQKYTNTDFMDALHIIGEQYNVDVETKLAEIKGKTGTENTVDYKVLRACVQSAAEYYEQKFNALTESHPAKRTILDRKLSLDEEKLDVYLGYADKTPTNLTKYLTGKNFSVETIIEAGLARKVDTKNGEQVFDVFTNRLLFAFTDQVGRIIGFSGRKLNEDDFGGKYVNTGETPLFHKGSLIYNFSNARKSIGTEQKVYVVEGQCDVIALQQSGIKNVVAISGTATTADHMKLLNRSVGTNGQIIFCLDGDTAGLKAMKKTVEAHKIAQNKGFAVVFATGADPCSFYTENGSQALVGYIKKQQKTAATFITHICTNGLDINSTHGQQKSITRLSSICVHVDNDSFVYMCANDLAKKISYPTDSIYQSVKENSGTRSQRTLKTDDIVDNAKNAPIPHSVSMGIDNVDMEKILEQYNAIANHSYGAIELRLFALFVRFPGIVLKAEENHKEPSFKVKTINEVYKISQKLSHSGKMVPENYGRYAAFASILFFDDSLLPGLHLMSFKEIAEHYDYLIQRHEFIDLQSKREKEQKEIFKFLQQNSNLSLRELQKEMATHHLSI